MKRIQILVAVASLLCFTACDQPSKKPPAGLDGVVVQDRNGDCYLLKWWAGDAYIVHPLGTNVTWKVPQ